MVLLATSDLVFVGFAANPGSPKSQNTYMYSLPRRETPALPEAVPTMASTGDPTVPLIVRESQSSAESYYHQWVDERDAIQRSFDTELRDLEYGYRTSTQSVENEHHRNMQVVASGGQVSVTMMQPLMDEQKTLKLKALEDDFHKRQNKVRAHYNNKLLANAEKFSDEVLTKMAPLASIRTATARNEAILAASNVKPPTNNTPMTMPFYGRPPLGSNAEPRPQYVDNARQQLPPPPPAPYQHAGEYARPGAPRQQSSFHEQDYARQQPGTRRSLQHDEYSTPDRQDRQHTVDRSFVNTSIPVHPNDGRVRHPLPGGHQKILPSSTPMTAEPDYVTDPYGRSGSVKRKADTQEDLQNDREPTRRTRMGPVYAPGERPAQAVPLETVKGPSEAADKAKAPTPRAVPKPPAVKRTIDFNEVYQDGDAEYKHIIIQYPPGEKFDWYILKCDEHGVHFNTNPLHGAAKHLHSSQHNNMSKEHALAIQELGHMVWDCNKELAAKNNAAVKLAFDKGYKPFNRNQLTKTERRSMGFPVPDSVPARRPAGPGAAQRKKDKAALEALQQGAHPGDFPGVAYPLDGELYLGYWSKNKTRYAVMLLPWGSLGPVGLAGNLKGTGLLDRPPRCYTIDRGTREILGWAEGFEDGGRLVTKREFPVMYFDGNSSVGWLRAKDLSPFHFEDPNLRSIPHYDDARDGYARARPQNFSSYEKMKAHYAAFQMPPKLTSAIRVPPRLVLAREIGAVDDEREKSAASAAHEGAPFADMNGTPPPDGSAEVNGRGGPVDAAGVDVEMADAGPAGDDADETESLHTPMPNSSEYDAMENAERMDDAAPADDADSLHTPLLDSSDDEAMDDVDESRRTAVSNKAAERDENGTSEKAAALSDQEAAAPPTEVSAAATTESAITDKPKDAAALVMQTTESAAQITLKEAADLVTSRSRASGTPTASRRRDSDSSLSSVGSAPPRRVIKIHARRSGSARASESPSLAPSTLATTNGAAASPSSPRTEDSIVLLPVNKTAPAVGQARTGPLVDDASKVPAAEVERESRIPRSGKEPTPFRPSSASAVASGAADNKQPAQSSSAVAPVTTAVTAILSDTSSSISSPRSPTPPTLATAAALSRTSTPTIIRPDDTAQSSRWRAVRSESGPEVVAPSTTQTQQPAAVAAALTTTSALASKEPSKEPSKEASTAPAQSFSLSRTSTPLPSTSTTTSVPPTLQPASLSGEVFELAYYSDSNGQKFHKQKDGPFLRVAIDKAANTIQTVPGQEGDMSPKINIDPRDVASMDVYLTERGNDAPCLVRLVAKSGALEQDLIFETSKAMGREESGRIHGRRFYAWVKRVNGAVEYRNHTHDHSEKPITGYSRN